MKETVRKLMAVLSPIYGEGEARAMTRLIFHALKGWSATDMVIHADDELSPYIKNKIDDIIARLVANEPIQYVLGEAYFYGMDLKVGEGVLIPRPETEGLVDMIVKDADGRPDLRVADVCTGSGCIAIALARQLRFPMVTAIDISPAALGYARENAAMMKTSIDFIEADVMKLQTIPGYPYDIIVSNPPYIDDCEKEGMEPNVLDFEPREALFVPDDDPLMFYRKILSLGRDSLAVGGSIYFEINPRHSNELKAMATDMGYADITVTKDIHNRERYFRCTYGKR